MVNDKKTGWAWQWIAPIQQTLVSVNQVQSPPALQPLRRYFPVKCVCVCVCVCAYLPIVVVF